MLREPSSRIGPRFGVRDPVVIAFVQTESTCMIYCPSGTVMTSDGTPTGSCSTMRAMAAFRFIRSIMVTVIERSSRGTPPAHCFCERAGRTSLPPAAVGRGSRPAFRSARVQPAHGHFHPLLLRCGSYFFVRDTHPGQHIFPVQFFGGQIAFHCIQVGLHARILRVAALRTLAEGKESSRGS